eukprot:3682387-Pyramimonas_sp.AAC.1
MSNSSERHPAAKGRPQPCTRNHTFETPTELGPLSCMFCRPQGPSDFTFFLVSDLPVDPMGFQDMLVGRFQGGLQGER